MAEQISVTIFEPSEPMAVRATLVFKNKTVASDERVIMGKDILYIIMDNFNILEISSFSNPYYTEFDLSRGL